MSIYILFYFLFYFTLGSSLPYFSQFFVNLDISGSNIGLIFASSSFLSMIFQPFIGYLNDRLKKYRELLSLMVILSSISLISMTFTSNYISILILYSIYFITMFCEMPLMDTVSLRTHHPFGKIRLWGSIGFAVGAIVSGKVIEFFGLTSFLYLATVLGILTVITILKLPIEKNSDTIAHEKMDLKKLFSNKKYLIFILVSALFLGTNNGNNSYFGVYYKEIGGGIALLGTTIFLMTFSEVPFMSISNKLIAKKGVEFVVTLSVFFLVVRWGIYFFFPNPKIITGTFFFQGASIGLFFAVANLYVRSIVDRNILGTAITIFMAAGSLGGIFIQYISGVIIESHSSIYIYIVFAGITSIALLLMFITKNIKIK